MTNQEKIQYLLQYHRLESEIDQLLEERNRWKEKIQKLTSGYLDASQGTGSEDRLKRAQDKIIEIEERLTAKIDKLTDKRIEIDRQIEAIADHRLRCLLHYRYIDGLTWGKVAGKMNYDYRWIMRLHRKSLDRLAIESHRPSMLS